MSGVSVPRTAPRLAPTRFPVRIIVMSQMARAGDAVMLTFTAVGIDGNPLGARQDDSAPPVNPEP